MPEYIEDFEWWENKAFADVICFAYTEKEITALEDQAAAVWGENL